MPTTLCPEPANPIAAATHPDPYLYYQRLATGRPFYFDEGLGLWVASSAAAVSAVLGSPALRVRPPAEPVPAALLGSVAGEIFGRLVRMTDGPAHAAARRRVAGAFEAVPAAAVAQVAEEQAALLAGQLGLPGRPEELPRFAFALPVWTVASLLGVEREALAEVEERVSRFVRCLFPASTPEQIAAGKEAAVKLLEAFAAKVRAPGPPSGSLFAGLLAARGRAEPEDLAADAIGLACQSYEATAGLLGNGLVALARRPRLRAAVRAHPELLGSLVEEVLRHDPPVQNTRRFAAETVAIEGQEVPAGATVLVLLAAANRDPAANAVPRRFLLRRPKRRIFSFGAGAHACPGRALATRIAVAGLAELLRSGLDPGRLEPRPTYRPSANARVPRLELRPVVGRAKEER